MSLYGDLPQAKEGDGAGAANKGWAGSASKLQPSLRKPTVSFAPASVLRAAAGGRGPGPAGRSLPAPVGRGTGGRGGGTVPTSLAAPVPAPAAAAAGITPPDAGSAAVVGGGGGPIVVSALTFFSTHGEPIVDEYDPSRPNDYEDVLRQRERQRRDAEEEAERVKRQREADMEAERRKREQAEAVAAVLAMSRPQEPPATASSGAPHIKEEPGAAPDVDERERRLKMSGEEAFAARARLSRGGAGAAVGPGPSAQGGIPVPAAAAAAAATAAAGGGAGPKGLGLAQKLLEKMGWREGEGLGRNRQGIATPLIAQKRGDHAAVIVNAPERPRAQDPADGPAEKRLRVGAVLGAPSRVLVLRNMVGPGQVDEDLEEEVGEELSKYGQVVDVKIFEVLSQGFDPAEAVRIFVAFDRVESAVKAHVDLAGRFFGGKEVRVAFFSEERFDKQDLAPAAGEFVDG